MFDKNLFPFDTEKMMEMFKTPDFTKMMTEMKFPAVSPEELMATQKKNMDALVEANKAAAAGYQDLFKKQVAIFEETMSEAQKQMKGFDASKLSPESAAAQTELTKAAVQKALANMKMLAETAQKANADAYTIVSARIKESVAELQDMAAKLQK
ncbi:phasin family protein [Oceanicella sp. SM1341]|uniref:phasin family protein n=1 Tax=Oceanicella sp. SM1341 TaxID=1548889 RepID=UPI0013005825|nr:TIGR01841 family phasin [Oceanicella sp. SM1341]